MAKRLKSLEGVASESPIVLLDTSALLSFLRDTRNAIDFRGKTEHSEIARKSAVFFREHKMRSNFYVTPGVLNQYLRKQSYPYRKAIRKNISGEGFNPDRVEFYRAMRKDDKERRKLIEEFESNGRVLILNDGEKEFSRDFDKYLPFKRESGLSETNFDLLVTGMVVSVTRNPVSLISNNFKILEVWKKILIGESVSPRQFGFFFRQKFDFFERANAPY